MTDETRGWCAGFAPTSQDDDRNYERTAGASWAPIRPSAMAGSERRGHRSDLSNISSMRSLLPPSVCSGIHRQLLAGQLIFVFAVLGCHTTGGVTPTATVGERTLASMHAAYASSWYHTLTFRQRTTIYTPSGEPQIEQWYESLAQLNGRTVLRIDRGSPTEGNGVLYTADSMWVFRNGKLAAQRAGGNEFLPLIEGVYVQPVAQTAAELKREGFDLTKGYDRSWNGARVTVVGVASATDTTTPQFWVDRERNLLVRMIIALTPTQTFDVRLEQYERAGGGWLATHVALLSGGRPAQTEDYSDWHVDVPLADALFDINHWTSARHWASE